MGTITRSFANNITTSGVLLPASLTNNSIANVTAYNAAIATGNMVLISSQTASASASISFTTGIDSTYKEYQFWFINIHPSISDFPGFQASTDGGSNYGVTATTTFFRGQQTEAGADATLDYDTSMDLAQSTSLARLGRPILIDNDASLSGTLTIFNPSSTTYVKHYMYNNQLMGSFCQNAFGAGYFNTTSAINAIQFKMSSGNIDDGTILMFGIV
jgi:hypothetical protein